MKKIVSFLMGVIFLFIFFGCNKPPENVDDGKDNSFEQEDEPTVTELKIKREPIKLNYNEEDKFDTAGLLLEAVWSDNEVEQLLPYECKWYPKGGLTALDSQVFFEYEGKKTQLDITVTPFEISELYFIKKPYILRLLKGTNLAVQEMRVGVKKISGENIEVFNYNITVDGKAFISDNNVLDVGSHDFEVSYKNKKISFKIDVFDGIVLEAENILQPEQISEEISNYVLVTQKATNGKIPTKISKESEPASMGSYMGEISKGATFEFHLFLEKERDVNLLLRAASGKMDVSYGWTPIKMGEMQFNKLFEIRINGSIVNISDDVVLPGSETDNEKGDSLLWVNWMDVVIGEVSLVKGDNIIEFKVISEYTHSSSIASGGPCACNIDRLEVIF